MKRSAIPEEAYRRYLAALIAGDRLTCTSIVEDLLIDGTRTRDLYAALFQRSMYAVGDLWEHRKISVAVEHQATAITERMLALVQPRAFPGTVAKRTIVVACVADEHHQLGGRIIADLCEARGWRALFLGANTPVEDLLHLLADVRPHVLGLSLGLTRNLPGLRLTLDAVAAAFPSLPILVGGRALTEPLPEAAGFPPQAACVESLEDLEHRLSGFENGPEGEA